jgi:carboxyl-terminal processing protease
MPASPEHDLPDAAGGWSPTPGADWSSGPIPTPPAETSTPETPPSRTPLIAAIILVAVLAGSALFASGFTLGVQQSLTPGTGSEEQGLFDPFWEAYRKISAEYVGGYDRRALVQGAIKGMFGALDDPYSSYMTQEEYEASLSGIAGEFEGIGATMSAEDAARQTCTPLGPKCLLLVVDVIAGSPAEAAGLRAGDRLTAVDGTTVDGSTMQQTIDRVRGPRGTKVVLSLLRGDDPVELSITRDVIRTSSVSDKVLADGTVGYLRIDGFSGNAAADFRSELQAQLDQGVRKFVLDLRDDPGGFVDAALSIASQFIDSGPVYWEEYADGQRLPVAAAGDGIAVDPGIAVAVLVNGGSASASEILAGALHDTGRATLVGETTYGKGTIQQWHLLSGEAGGFRLSIAKWLTPNQTWIHGKGITPDVVVPFPDDTPQGQDPQLAAALEVLAKSPASSPAPRPSLAAPSGSPSQP